MGKLVKRKRSIDRLSDLPDSILSHILSLLPTKYAVRTSVLSSRWRYLSTSVTSLCFDDYGNPSDKFMNFVDRVLSFHNRTCLERFRLICNGFDKDVDAYRICGWISFALRQPLQELCLEIAMGDPSGMLPASLFTNKTLVKVKLDVYYFEITIPTKVCFPSLKSLHLEFLEFVDDDDSVQRLFSNCPVLEDLLILACFFHNIEELNISNPSLKRFTLDCDRSDEPFHIAIDAPSLVYFKYSDNLTKSYSLVNLHSLVEADFTYLFDDGDGLGDQDIATNLLRGISNVQSLCLSAEIITILNLCDKPLPVFHNLVSLEIGTGFDGGGLEKLLEVTPQLRTLIFKRMAFRGLICPPPEEVPSCLLSHLKVITIHSFRGQMELVEYFLKNASVLEKLKIQMELKVKWEFEIAKKLLMLPRESRICQVEIV